MLLLCLQQSAASEVLPVRLSEGFADLASLKCRQGQSSYSLRALKIVPKYNDNGFGIALKPKAKPHTLKEDVIKTNNTNGEDNQQIEFDNSPINALPNEIFCMVCII